MAKKSKATSKASKKKTKTKTPTQFPPGPATHFAPEPKSPGNSSVLMTEMVLPSDTNVLGNIFGGRIMSWMDIAAALAAGRHARRVCVTASFDALHFINPVKLGHVVHIKAIVNHAGRTSMEVGVRVDSEDPITGEMTHTASAYTTFVAIDDMGKPVPVPPLAPQTEDERRRQRQAIKRRETRMRLAEELHADGGHRH